MPTTIQIKKEKLDVTDLQLPIAGLTIKKERLDTAFHDSMTTTTSSAGTTPARTESPVDTPPNKRNHHRHSNDRRSTTPADPFADRSDCGHRNRGSNDRRSPSHHDTSRSSHKHGRSRHHNDRNSEQIPEDDRYGRDRKSRNDSYDRTPRDRNSHDRYERTSRRSRDRQLSPGYDRLSPYERRSGDRRPDNCASPSNVEHKYDRGEQQSRFKDRRSPERDERNRSATPKDRYGSPDYDINPRPSTSGHRSRDNHRDDKNFKSRFSIWSDPIPMDKRNTLEFAVKSEFERHNKCKKRVPLPRADPKNSVFNRLGAKIVEAEPKPSTTVLNPAAVASENIDAIPLPPPFVRDAGALGKPKPPIPTANKASDSAPIEPPPLTQAEIDEADSDNEGRFGETEEDLNAKKLNELHIMRKQLQSDIILADPRQNDSLWVSKNKKDAAPKPNVAVPPSAVPHFNNALWTPKNLQQKKPNAAVLPSAAKPAPSFVAKPRPENRFASTSSHVNHTPVSRPDNPFTKPPRDESTSLFDRPHPKTQNVAVTAPTSKSPATSGFGAFPLSASSRATVSTAVPANISVPKDIAALLKDDQVMGMVIKALDSTSTTSANQRPKTAESSGGVPLSATLESMMKNKKSEEQQPNPPLEEIASPNERLAYKYNPKPRPRSDDDRTLPIEPIGRTAIVQPRVNMDTAYRPPPQPSLPTTAVHPYQHHPTINQNNAVIRSRDPRLASANNTAHNSSPQYSNSPASMPGHSPLDYQSGHSPGMLSPNSPDDARHPYAYGAASKATHHIANNGNNIEIFPNTYRDIEVERLKYEQSRKYKWNNTTAQQTYGDYRRSKQDPNKSKERLPQLSGKPSSSNVVDTSSTVGSVAKSAISATAKSQLDNMYATGNYATSKPSSDTNFKIPKINKKPTTETVAVPPTRQAKEQIVGKEPIATVQNTRDDSDEENWDNEDTGIVFDIESNKQKPDSTLLDEEPEESPDSDEQDQDKEEEDEDEVEEEEEVREPTPPPIKRVLRTRSKSLYVQPKPMENLQPKLLKKVLQQKAKIEKEIVPVETSSTSVEPIAIEAPPAVESITDRQPPEATASVGAASSDMTKEWITECLKNIFTEAAKPVTKQTLDQDSVLKMLSTVIDPERYNRVKQVLGLLDEQKPADGSGAGVAATETDDTVSASDADDTVSIADKLVTAKRKPPKKKMNELQKLNEDIRTMFISDGVLTATGRRMCTIIKSKESPTTEDGATKRGRQQTAKVQQQLKVVVKKLELAKEEPKGE